VQWWVVLLCQFFDLNVWKPQRPCLVSLSNLRLKFVKRLWKSSCDEELWTGRVAAAGSGVDGGLETWMRRVENVWIRCGGRGVTSG
jgi:hypothetical protein